MQAFQTELLTSVLKTTSLHQTNHSNTLSLHTQAQYSVQLPRPDASNPGIYLGLVWAEFETQASVYHLTIHWFIHLTSFDSEQRPTQEIRLSNTNRPGSGQSFSWWGPPVWTTSTSLVYRDFRPDFDIAKSWIPTLHYSLTSLNPGFLFCREASHQLTELSQWTSEPTHPKAKHL